MNNKLNVLLSDLVVFYHKLQNKHWYVSGHTFFQVHEQMENLYNEILPQVDTVAELILMIGGKPVSTLKEFSSLSTIVEGTSEYVGNMKELFGELAKDYQHLLQSAVAVKEDADQESNYLVSTKMDELIESYSKTIWMIAQASL